MQPKFDLSIIAKDLITTRLIGIDGTDTKETTVKVKGVFAKRRGSERL